MRRAWPVLLALSACSEPREPAEIGVFRFVRGVPRNLVVLSIDTLRKDHVGAHGGGDLTPFLDRIAAEAVVLDDHQQCSDWTTASTTCTLAGSTNTDRGLALPVAAAIPDTDTLPGWLADAGFYSVLATGNDYFSRDKNVTVQFDEEYPVFGTAGGALDVAAQGIDALVKARRKRGRKQPWYLHLHFMEPHAPYTPADAFLGPLDAEPWPEDLRDPEVLRAVWPQTPFMDPEQLDQLEANLRWLYAGEIRQLDHRIARIWDDLDREGLLDDALVVLWSDHGEQFWDHGHPIHAKQLHAEENDAILWFWARGLEPARLDLPTQSIDLVPTLLEVFGLPTPDEVTGLPLDAVPADRVRFAATNGFIGPHQAVTAGGLKLHYAWGTGQVELYDRRDDPAERSPLSLDDPRAAELWCLLEPEVARMEAALPPDTPRVAPDLPPCPSR